MDCQIKVKVILKQQASYLFQPIIRYQKLIIKVQFFI